MSTTPRGRHVVRLEFTHVLPAPANTLRTIRAALVAHPGCDLAATEIAVTVGVPVLAPGDAALWQVADQVDGALARLDLPEHAVSTFSWTRRPAASRLGSVPPAHPQLDTVLRSTPGFGPARVFAAAGS